MTGADAGMGEGPGIIGRGEVADSSVKPGVPSKRDRRLAVGDRPPILPIGPPSLEGDSGIHAKAWAGARPNATHTVRDVMRIT